MKETKAAAPVGAGGADARVALHEVLGAFEAFKAANDERLGALERGRGDGLLEEKVARIDAALGAAEARLERVASEGRRPVLGGAVPHPVALRASVPPHEGEGDLERKAAWSGYMKAGSTLGLEFKAGLSEGGSGGYVAPAETERLIERRLMAASPMREIATVRSIGAGLFKKPVSIAGPATGWVAETAARPEADPSTLALLEFPAGEIYAAPAATQSLLDDAVVDLDEWLASEVEDAFAAQETAAFVSGDGVNKPKGFLSYTAVAEGSHAWGSMAYVATGAAGAFPADDPADKLIELVYAPKAQFRPNGRFVMNRRTVSAIRRFKDADGNYVLQPARELGQTASLLGYPVTEIETMPDVGANAFAVAFGDFAKGYLIVDRAGVRVLRDPYSAKPYVLFYTTKRVGGGVQNFDAVKLLKFSAS